MKLIRRFILLAVGLMFPSLGNTAGFILSGATVTISGSPQLSTVGDFQLQSGALSAGAATLSIGKNWIMSGGSFNAGLSTVSFTGTTTGLQITSQGNPFANVAFRGIGGYWTLQDSMTALGSVTLAAGTLDTGSNFEIGLTTDWSSSGGTFVPNQSTVTLAGVAGSTSAINGSNAFYSLECQVPAKTLALQAGFVQTITRTLQLMGSSGQLLRVRSQTAGAFAYLTNTGTNTVRLADVQDSNAGGGLLISAGGSSVNSGHNVNWNFGHIVPSNAVISAVYVSSLSATWDSVTAEDGYVLEASTASDFSGTLISSATFDGNAMGATLPSTLSANTTYFARVGSRWSDGTTEYIDTLPASTSTLSVAPGNVQLTTLFATTAAVTWTALPGSPQTATAEGYLLQASDNSQFSGSVLSSSTVDITASSLTISGLQPNTPYFFRVESLNWNNAPDSAGVLTGVTPTEGTPRAPDEIWGAFNSATQVFALSWHAVTLNLDGLAASIDHYVVQTYTAIDGDPTSSVPVPAGTLTYSQTTGGNTFYFRVLAVATNGFASNPSDYVDSTPQANRYVLASDDEATRSVVPSSLVKELLRENNAYGDDVVLSLARRALDETTPVLRSYSLTAARATTGVVIPDFAWSQPAAALSIDLGSSGNGAPSHTAAGSQPVALFWSNGQSFIPLTTPATVSNTSSVASAIRNMGVYQVREAVISSQFQLAAGSPYPRVITPNAANNRRVFFFLDNPQGDPLSGAIYTMQGAKIRDLSVNSQSPSPNALVWDGKDNSGTLVRSGVYLYKIRGSTTLTGTVVVAR